MNRVEFLDSISGIKYPEMIADFFDHFVALKQIVEDSGVINVLSNPESNNCSIMFSITFINNSVLMSALDTISTLNGSIVIYERQIAINVKVPTDNNNTIIITLC